VVDGVSVLIFKSYDQRREAFQGTEQDVIWLDEEPPLGIYTECLLRTMTTGGHLLCTFTPLLGLSEVVLSFLPGGQLQVVDPSLKQPKYVVMATWDDAPHLTSEQKDSLWASIPVHQRDARTKGIPQLGSGAIYPLGEDEITCEPFEIPKFWPKVYALDVGWNWTAALWGAVDQENDIVYLYSEYKAGQAEPPIHAAAICSRGPLPGVIDPAARGRSQIDGQKLFELYEALGLDLTLAENAREAGIYEVWQRLSTGRLKVFRTLSAWLGEFRIYRRDENGKIVKENDHLMDDTRYLVVSGLSVARTRSYFEDVEENEWMYKREEGRNATTGY
jgi:phage terminase large subunit-like protein